MSTDTITKTSTLGAFHLTVSDLDRALAYYGPGLGLALRERDGEVARLGTEREDLLVIKGDLVAPRARGACGLFHFAILLPSRKDLSLTLHHLIEARVRIDGASDHGVSEALYLTDPDGHG